MTISVQSEEAMRIVGQSIGSHLRGGECIELVGDVGAGKTTLTKGIAAGLGITDTVQSPTFTINRTYDAPSGIRLSHYDFYRLSDPGIMSEELRETVDDHKAAIVIEWGEIVGSVLPDDHLKILFQSPAETERTLVFEATGPKSTQLVKDIE